MRTGVASAVRSVVLPDRSIVLYDPDPAQLRAGFRYALERVGCCGPQVESLAAAMTADFGTFRCGLGTFREVSWLKAPRPSGGVCRIFPGPAAERLAPILLSAIGA